MTPTGTLSASNSPLNDPHSFLNPGCKRAIYLRCTQLPQDFEMSLQTVLHIFISILNTGALLKKKAKHYKLIKKQEKYFVLYSFFFE
jgi:hypothetical protein